jgi:hypothetical protein
VKINEIETKNSIQRINETKSWFFEKINKIDKPLANLTKMRREKTQTSKIRNEIGELTANTTERLLFSIMAFFHRSKTHTMPGAQRSSSLCPQG